MKLQTTTTTRPAEILALSYTTGKVELFDTFLAHSFEVSSAGNLLLVSKIYQMLLVSKIYQMLWGLSSNSRVRECNKRERLRKRERGIIHFEHFLGESIFSVSIPTYNNESSQYLRRTFVPTYLHHSDQPLRYLDGYIGSKVISTYVIS